MTQPPDESASAGDPPVPGEGWAQSAPGTSGAPGYGPPGAAGGYGQPSGAPGYGPPGAAGGYGQPGPAGYAPPVGPPKRFSGAMIAVGILTGMVLAVMLPFAAAAAGSSVSGSSGAGVAVALALAVLVPLVVGIVMVRRGSPERRGFGLGALIGWGVVTIVGGGLCVAIIVSLSQGTGP